MVSNRFRLGLTNIYSIDEYKTKVCFSILNILSYVSYCTTLPPVLQRSKFCFRRLNKTHIKQLQSVDILHFLTVLRIYHQVSKIRTLIKDVNVP